jgi:MFS family permease
VVEEPLGQANDRVGEAEQVGVGLTIPSLLAAGSASLPPARFGTGSGALNMARQIGTVLGVAGLVAILAHVDHTDPVATFREGVYLVAAFGIAAGLAAAMFLARRASSAPAPTVAAAEPG